MAETEYTRRDIESVAEKEWGRIDIVTDTAGTGYYDSRAIPIAQIKSLG